MKELTADEVAKIMFGKNIVKVSDIVKKKKLKVVK